MTRVDILLSQIHQISVAHSLPPELVVEAMKLERLEIIASTLEKLYLVQRKKT